MRSLYASMREFWIRKFTEQRFCPIFYYWVIRHIGQSSSNCTRAVGNLSSVNTKSAVWNILIKEGVHGLVILIEISLKCLSTIVFKHWINFVSPRYHVGDQHTLSKYWISILISWVLGNIWINGKKSRFYSVDMWVDIIFIERKLLITIAVYEDSYLEDLFTEDCEPFSQHPFNWMWF